MSDSVVESDSEEEGFVSLDHALGQAPKANSLLSKAAREGEDEAAAVVVLTAPRIVANTTTDEDVAAVAIAPTAKAATEGDAEMAIDAGTPHVRIA